MSESLGAVVAQLRSVAATAARTGVVDAPALHSDADLLKLCADILDMRAQIAALWREARKLPRLDVADPTYKAEVDKVGAVKRDCMSPMARVGKVAAKTAAGVYAKVLVLRVRGHSTPAGPEHRGGSGQCAGPTRKLLAPRDGGGRVAWRSIFG